MIIKQVRADNDAAWWDEDRDEDRNEDEDKEEDQDQEEEEKALLTSEELSGIITMLLSARFALWKKVVTERTNWPSDRWTNTLIEMYGHI